jgi:hypothetical protein
MTDMFWQQPTATTIRFTARDGARRPKAYQIQVPLWVVVDLGQTPHRVSCTRCGQARVIVNPASPGDALMQAKAFASGHWRCKEKA